LRESEGVDGGVMVDGVVGVAVVACWSCFSGCVVGLGSDVIAFLGHELQLFDAFVQPTCQIPNKMEEEEASNPASKMVPHDDPWFGNNAKSP
jgi:hypothetical protein